jgi:hypothetical protein
MIQQLAFSGDGTRLAIVQTAFTRIVNATSGQELVTLNNSRDAYALAYSRMVRPSQRASRMKV